jgi:hypothetical protein
MKAVKKKGSSESTKNFELLVRMEGGSDSLHAQTQTRTHIKSVYLDSLFPAEYPNRGYLSIPTNWYVFIVYEILPIN